MGLRNVLNSAVAALSLGTGAVSAQDLVLMVGNEAYRNFNPVSNARAVLGAASAFEAAGYQVIEVADATESQMKSALDQVERLHGDADRVVVVLSGQFMKTKSSTWFAPTDLQSPSLANVGFDALPLSAVLSYLGEKPGGAALFLADEAGGAPVEASIQKGIGHLRIPQGVLVAKGTPSAVRRALLQEFLR